MAHDRSQGKQQMSVLSEHLQSLYIIYKHPTPHHTDFGWYSTPYMQSLLREINMRITSTSWGKHRADQLRTLEAIRADILIELLLMDQG